MARRPPALGGVLRTAIVILFLLIFLGGGQVIPLITGEAIILMNYYVRIGADGWEQVETRITTYSRIDNPVIAALVKVFQPLLRNVVNDKLAQGFLAVHSLGELLAADPEQVYRQAEAVSDADKADMEALRALLLPALKRGS